MSEKNAPKKSAGRRALRVIGIVIVVLVVVLAIVVMRVGTIVKSSVNTLGPQMLGVPVSLQHASFYPLKGEIRMRDLVIGSPDEEKFGTNAIFRLGGLSVDIAMAELLKGDVHIKDVTITGPEVWYQKTLTSSNIGRLLEILEEKYPKDDSDKEKKDEPKKEKKDGKPVVIDHFLFDEGYIGSNLFIGKKIPLLKIEMHDIGKEGAFMPGQIVVILVKNILSSVVSLVTSAGGAAVDAVGDVGGAAVDAVGAVGGMAKDAVGGAAKAIGSLIGGKDKAEEGEDGAKKAPESDESKQKAEEAQQKVEELQQKAEKEIDRATEKAEKEVGRALGKLGSLLDGKGKDKAE